MKQLGEGDGWLYLGKIVLRVGKSDIKITTEKTAG